MTGMLASVNSLAEARFMLDFGVDILDLKQPAQGALGALPIAAVSEIVSSLQPAPTISATVGDLPMQADVVYAAVAAMAATGVDYVKLGFFPGGDWQACLDRLTSLTGDTALIAVLFADTQPDFNWVSRLKLAGFKGVMLDTMDKGIGSLTQCLGLSRLDEFVTACRSAELISGLAGSLQSADIAVLKPLQADYLGFRGALCENRRRTATLDAQRIKHIRQLI